MGKIVQFDTQLRLERKSRPREGQDAIVLMFTGVRYEHEPTKSSKSNTPHKPGRKRG